MACEGTPALVKLSADKKVISPADGTDDVHVTVKVADAFREADSQCRSGDAHGGVRPWEFPTGKSITFTPERTLTSLTAARPLSSGPIMPEKRSSRHLPRD